MMVPPCEWPTRMTGLLTRESARLTAATSPSSESRLFWVDTTSWPSACSVGISLLKHEPSAQSPWANTILGLCEVRCDAKMLISVLLFPLLEQQRCSCFSKVPSLHVTTYIFLVLSNSRTRTVGTRSRSSVLVAVLHPGRDNRC